MQSFPHLVRSVELSAGAIFDQHAGEFEDGADDAFAKRGEFIDLELVKVVVSTSLV